MPLDERQQPRVGDPALAEHVERLLGPCGARDLADVVNAAEVAEQRGLLRRTAVGLRERGHSRRDRLRVRVGVGRGVAAWVERDVGEALVGLGEPGIGQDRVHGPRLRLVGLTRNDCFVSAYSLRL